MSEPGGPAEAILPIYLNVNHVHHMPVPSVVLFTYSLFCK